MATSKADPLLSYVSYYSGGLRVLRIQGRELQEVGAFIDEGGNNFWGVEVFSSGGEEYVAASDRDHGLYIFRHTGFVAVRGPQRGPHHAPQARRGPVAPLGWPALGVPVCSAPGATSRDRRVATLGAVENLRVAHVPKRFTRLSQTFALDEALALAA
ncbi:MAG: hypothetical protein M3P95_06220 [Actinomycetota bacterium]|nr:hypothetical protein [Actinomycetota bacterium]